MSNDQVVLGRISGLYGVRGWIKVYSYTEQRENILDYADWDLGGARYRLEQGKVHGKGIIDLDNGELDLVFKMQIIPEIIRALPGIGQLAEFLFGDLVGARTIGTLKEPRTALVPKARLFTPEFGVEPDEPPDDNGDENEKKPEDR